MLMGSTTYNKVSRFVNEIPQNLLEYTGGRKTYGGASYSGSASSNPEKISIGTGFSAGKTANKSFNSFTKPAAQSGVSYKVGDSVMHKVFGKGMITKAEKMGNDTMLEVSFDKVGTKTLMANFCKMEKI